MKKVLFESQVDLEKKRKNFSIHSRTEDKQCKTQIQKSFTYVVARGKEQNPGAKAPLVFIQKSFDTKRGVEEFSFHVKGYFHLVHNDVFLKVLFHHTLDIRIQWKVNDFSPKKSASLT
jgi:hypothetical protein